MRIGLVDHFDSFTYNIVMLLEAIGEEVIVIDHHASLEQCLALEVDAWVLGPGPGSPEQTGVSRHLIGTAPTLGICLGHQLIGYVFGAQVVRARPHHGVRMRIYHCGRGLFEQLPDGFWGVRYHSLLLTQIPENLEVTAWTEGGEVMAIQHRELPLFGVQFHPDSIATEWGEQLMSNFINGSRALNTSLGLKGGAQVLGLCQRETPSHRS